MMKAISMRLIAIVSIIIIVIAIAGAYYFQNSPKGVSSLSSTSSTNSFSTVSHTGSSTNTVTTNNTTTLISATITAGGSTLVAPLMQQWITEFEKQYSGIQLTYSAVGSGQGNQGFIQGVYDIGATDVPPPAQYYQQMLNEYGVVLVIPDTIGSVAIIYNIPGFNGTLNFSADILGKIYTGKIMYWDDPEIKQLNPHANLPHQKIIAVHRSDGSGTTYIFTYWLYLSSPTWRDSGVGYGFTVNWPVDSLGNGLGGKGSDGVAAQVKNNPYSIGYVEVQYAIANNILSGNVLNPSTGQLAKPNVSSIEIAVQNANLSEINSLTGNLSTILGVFLNVKANGAYPIVTFSWLVVKVNYTDLSKAEAIYLFLKYIATQGQTNLPPGYVPLPQNVQQLILNNLKLITYNGKPVYQIVG